MFWFRAGVLWVGIILGLSYVGGEACYNYADWFPTWVVLGLFLVVMFMDLALDYLAGRNKQKTTK